MAWRDSLIKGSFRGAPFQWQKSDLELGRKTARHDYPQRDEAYIEDLGKAPREFTLEALVIGPDYMQGRDRLIAALEEPGPGTLVHPTMGTMRVALASKPRLSESTAEGGLARFTLHFVLAGDNKYPAAVADTGGAIATAAGAARASALDRFVRTYTSTRAPAFIHQAAKTLTERILDNIKALRGYVPGIPAAVTTFLSDVGQLRSATESLVRSPYDLGKNILGMVGSLGTLSDDPLAVIDLYRNLFDFGSDLPAIPTSTASRTTQADNQEALIALVQTTAVVEAVNASADVDYRSYQDAVALRDELADRIDTLLDTADDDTGNDLVALRVALVQDIGRRSVDLARSITYTPIATIPVLVLAHRLYGDAGRADDIVSRNRIRHPGFVAGGQQLEVLIDA